MGPSQVQRPLTSENFLMHPRSKTRHESNEFVDLAETESSQSTLSFAHVVAEWELCMMWYDTGQAASERSQLIPCAVPPMATAHCEKLALSLHQSQVAPHPHACQDGLTEKNRSIPCNQLTWPSFVGLDKTFASPIHKSTCRTHLHYTYAIYTCSTYMQCIHTVHMQYSLPVQTC